MNDKLAKIQKHICFTVAVSFSIFLFGRDLKLQTRTTLCFVVNAMFWLSVESPVQYFIVVAFPHCVIGL